MDSRHAQKSAPSFRPRSARWKRMAVRVDEARELEVVRHAREDTRVLRRLLVVGLAWAFFCAACARARRHGRDLLLPLVRRRRRSTAPGSTGTRTATGRRPTSTRASSRRAARTRAATRPSSSGRWREIAAAGVDEVVVSWWGRGSREDARLPLVSRVGARATGSPSRIHLEPYADRSPATVAARPRRTSRRSGSATSTSTTRATSRPPTGRPCAPQVPPAMRLFAGTELVGFAAAGALRRLLHVRLRRTTAAASSRGSARRRTPCTSLCAPSVGPATTAAAPASRRRRGRGRTARPTTALWTRRARRAPRHRDDHELQRVGRRDADRARRRPRRGYRGYDGAWGLHGRRRRRRLPPAHGVLDRRASTALR